MNTTRQLVVKSLERLATSAIPPLVILCGLSGTLFAATGHDLVYWLVGLTLVAFSGFDPLGVWQNLWLVGSIAPVMLATSCVCALWIANSLLRFAFDALALVMYVYSTHVAQSQLRIGPIQRI